MNSVFKKLDGEFSVEAYNDFLKSSQDIREPLINSIDGFFSIKIADIYQSFGDKKASALIDLFTIERKERDFKYYNDENPFVNQPLCKLGDTIFVAVPTFLGVIFIVVFDTSAFATLASEVVAVILPFPVCVYGIFLVLSP